LMDALDGNAIGGLLNDVFGAEMTATRGTCVHCGATMHMAELIVYMPAPGGDGPLPKLRERGDGHRRRAWDPLRRPARPRHARADLTDPGSSHFLVGVLSLS
jgi:Family of unknown function (DUF6510)